MRAALEPSNGEPTEAQLATAAQQALALALAKFSVAGCLPAGGLGLQRHLQRCAGLAVALSPEEELVGGGDAQ